MKKFSKGSILTIIVSLAIGLTGPIATFAATATAVDLGSISTNNFVILSKTGITSDPASVITGNIGTSLDTANSDAAFAGIACGDVIGSIYSIKALTPMACELSDVVMGTTITSTAVSNMGTAYTYAAGEPAGTGASFLGVGGGTLNGQTFVPGVYTWNSDVTITGDITLAGGANDIWVFQVNGILKLNGSKKIILSGGAQAKNIFWQVTGYTELFAASTFEGNILGWSYIAMDSGATLHGRALSNTAVTLIGNTIFMPATTVVVNKGRRTPTSTPIVPLIDIIKVPNPLALPAGPGKVTYNYTVWNLGAQQALTDVTVIDDKCIPVVFSSGDVNFNNKLDPGENWRYSCATTLTSTTTNTAIATGYSDDSYHHAAIATAIATVVVGTPIQPPLIHVVKVPSQLAPLPFGGGDVTYSYTVTNPGPVAIKNVNVTDDKCPNVNAVSVDQNGNGLLDTNETWTYTCKTNVKVSTGSVATAKGDANGLTAMAYAFTNVLVATPSLPNTAFGSQGLTISWLDIILALAVIILSVWLSMVINKGKNKINI